MTWNFNCVREFASEVESIQNSAAVRDAFMEGFMKGSVFYPKIAELTFNVDREERLSYVLDNNFETIITGQPSLDKCGADVNLLPDQGELRNIYYTPFKQSIALEACKDKCDKRTLTEYIVQRAYQAGVAFGRKYDQVFVYGVPEIGAAGISQVAGTKVQDFSVNTKYSDLYTADPNSIANFFSLILTNMEDPMICMGTTAIEAIGLRAMSNTGDTCSDIWDCVIARLSTRMGMSDEQARGLFSFHPMFDHVTGVDPNNPNDEKSVIWALDKAHFEQGLEDSENFGCVITKGHDLVESKVSMHMSAPHITRQGASRWIFGFIDQAVINECEGERYDDAGDSIGVTIPTPIV